MNVTIFRKQEILFCIYSIKYIYYFIKIYVSPTHIHMRSISLRTDFFKQQNWSNLSANPLTNYYQPTSVHTPSFIFLSSTVYEL